MLHSLNYFFIYCDYKDSASRTQKQIKVFNLVLLRRRLSYLKIVQAVALPR